MNNLASVFQLVSAVAVIICIITIPGVDKDIKTNWPWTLPYNATGIPDKDFGYVQIIGLLSALFAFSGYEAGCHAAEECINASVTSSYGIVVCCILTAASGFSYVLGLIYAIPSIHGMKYAEWAAARTNGWIPEGQNTWLWLNETDGSVLGNFTNIGGSWLYYNATSQMMADPEEDGYYSNYYNTYGSAWIQPWQDASVSAYLKDALALVADSDSAADLFFAACGWKTGMALTVLIAINLFFAGISSLTVTTRICYAMARDDAFPMSKTFSTVWPVTHSPIATVILVLILDVLLMLLPLASTLALEAILSVAVIGYQISYAIPLVLRATTGREVFKQNVFHLGKYSILIHAISGTWLTLTSFIFFFPFSWPVSVSGVNGVSAEDDNFNYTCVIVGSVFVFSLAYWVFGARHTYKGPLGRVEKSADSSTEVTTEGSAALVVRKVEDTVHEQEVSTVHEQEVRVETQKPEEG